MMKLYREMLGRFGGIRGPARVIVYGSVARGSSRPDSDVDIAVISASRRARESAESIADGILLDYGKTVSIVHFTPAKFRARSHEPLVKEIKRGEILHG